MAALYIPYIKLVFGQIKPLPGVTLATGSLYIYFYVFEVRESEYELSFTFYGHLDNLNPIWPPFYYITQLKKLYFTNNSYIYLYMP